MEADVSVRMNLFQKIRFANLFAQVFFNLASFGSGRQICWSNKFFTEKFRFGDLEAADFDIDEVIR